MAKISADEYFLCVGYVGFAEEVVESGKSQEDFFVPITNGLQVTHCENTSAGISKKPTIDAPEQWFNFKMYLPNNAGMWKCVCKESVLLCHLASLGVQVYNMINTYKKNFLRFRIAF